MNMNIGHQHPKVIKAIQDQAANYVTPIRHGHYGVGLSKRPVTPGNLNKTFFCLGG
jgi:4-aminobutyrate aminotransferase-like enzyme